MTEPTKPESEVPQRCGLIAIVGAVVIQLGYPIMIFWTFFFIFKWSRDWIRHW